MGIERSTFIMDEVGFIIKIFHNFSGSGVHGSVVCLTKNAEFAKSYELKRQMQDAFG